MTKKSRALASRMLQLFKPPERMKVWQWADENRTLTSESSAEPGKWRTERTPYMVPIYEAFTDPRTEKMFIKSSAQTAKSEVLINCFGYAVDKDPGPALWIGPRVEDVEDFSKERITGAIRNTPSLARKFGKEKSRDKSNTILKKSFPGGSLSMVGTNAPAGLRSKPIRYIFGDEWDAWAVSAGEEGDPFKLAEARTITFFNRKIVIVSTPTRKEDSPIDKAFKSGTQEEWRLQCPNCGEYHYIELKDIDYKVTETEEDGEKTHVVEEVQWRCPDCGFTHSEAAMKRQPGKMVAQNPTAAEKGIRSFRLSGWISPWLTWGKIVTDYLNAGDDPRRLQVVYNTLLGEVYEYRGELEDEETMMERREPYPAELPDGVLLLTCGVDVQANRLEYEVVGFGHQEEDWGIRKGIILGSPDDPETWNRLDDVIDRKWQFADGRSLKIYITCVDSGYKTETVMKECKKRYFKRVFAIKGMDGSMNVPYVNPAKAVPIGKDKRNKGWLYSIHVDIGKETIMQNLQTEQPGPRCSHFPDNPDIGYDIDFFRGLLSEIPVKRGKKWVWEKLKGHRRNEALDCRNYARAAFEIVRPADMQALEKRVQEQRQTSDEKHTTSKKRRKPSKREDLMSGDL